MEAAPGEYLPQDAIIPARLGLFMAIRVKIG